MKRLMTVMIAILAFITVNFNIQTASATTLEEQVLEIIRNNPEVIIDSVQKYQQQQYEKQQEAQRGLLKVIANNPDNFIGESPTQGYSKEVVLIEFSDFQCPFCAKVNETLNEFLDIHSDKVTLVYKHFPISQIHSEAMPAAKSAWAANKQGKFWAYQDALFSQQESLGEDLYIKIAQSLDLDLELFNHDRTSESANMAIQKDIELGTNLGIQGTPFFIMNGEAFSGAISLEEMESIFTKVN